MCLLADRHCVRISKGALVSRGQDSSLACAAEPGSPFLLRTKPERPRECKTLIKKSGVSGNRTHGASRSVSETNALSVGPNGKGPQALKEAKTVKKTREDRTREDGFREDGFREDCLHEFCLHGNS
jgi:hypothetical protein